MTENRPAKKVKLTSVRCPKCGTAVRIPLIWLLGVESIFRCRSCNTRFGTGFKAGAMLSGLAFVMAVATVNLVCLLFGSRAMMFLFYAALPLWIFYSFLLRRAWMMRRTRKRLGSQKF
ncbi:MAG: hypothetical protein LUF87_04505 [Alistipes sp.]|nr:hypothetical protein [Alistipes sp.]